MEKIAIIGANSFIARNTFHVLDQKSEDYEIKLYDYAEKQADCAENYRSINILSKESVAAMDLRCDYIFMFVGKTGSENSFDEYDSFIDINERALLNLLNEYRKQGSKAKIVFPSTRLVYKGKPGKLKEDAEKEFKTVYAINKYACEQYLEQYQRVFGVKYCILRICVPYGTLVPYASSYGTAEFMLNKATKGENIIIYGDGSVRRTLTYMGDLCETLIAGAFSVKCVNDVYNVGGENYSLRDIAELISRKYGVGVDYRPWPEVALKIESGDTVFCDEKLCGIIGNMIVSKFSDWILY